jgi:hypothetical protein
LVAWAIIGPADWAFEILARGALTSGWAKFCLFMETRYGLVGRNKTLLALCAIEEFFVQ